MPVIYQPGLSSQMISRLEGDLGWSLPEDYKDFLAKYNGFYINGAESSDIPFERVDSGFISFYCFFGYGLKNENRDLGSFNDEFISEISFLGKVLAIGEDPGGNPFVILPSEDNLSSVYYWDRTHLHAEDAFERFDIRQENECGNLYLVGNGFNDFYAKLMTALGAAVVFDQER